MNIEEIRKNAPDGATHYTPNGTLYVKDTNGQCVQVCRFGDTKWMEIPMSIDECYVEPL